MRFGIEEVDEEYFEKDPPGIDGKELPIYGRESNRIDFVREEATDFAENLLDSNATSSDGVWEQLNKIS